MDTYIYIEITEDYTSKAQESGGLKIGHNQNLMPVVIYKQNTPPLESHPSDVIGQVTPPPPQVR